jgi:hypothetical protein
MAMCITILKQVGLVGKHIVVILKPLRIDNPVVASLLHQGTYFTTSMPAATFTLGVNIIKKTVRGWWRTGEQWGLQPFIVFSRSHMSACHYMVNTIHSSKGAGEE